MASSELLKEIRKSFTVTKSGIAGIVTDFGDEMIKGLDGRQGSLKMLPAYVARPSGTEKGLFLALDLGGTNFRVLELNLLGRGKAARPVVRKFALKREHITVSGDVLFDFIAGCIRSFILKHHRDTKREQDIGFTFSFPVKQTGISSGTLVRWTKGFKAKGVEGQDVVEALNRSLAGISLSNVRVVALANDTVGTLVAKSYDDPACDVGVILGTGTNACYPEKISDIRKLKGPGMDMSGEMIINTEWGNFNKLALTPYDKELDNGSENPGEQLLEKQVSGMYLGELARLVIRDLTGKGHLFGGRRSALFIKKGSFKTEHMSLIESDTSARLSGTGNFLKKNKIVSTYDDRCLVKEICVMISTRAARVSAAALAAVLSRIDPDLSRKHTIAVDGTVFERYHGFRRRMHKALGEQFGRSASDKIKLALVKDGSGTGVAIIAAVASSRHQQKNKQVKDT